LWDRHLAEEAPTGKVDTVYLSAEYPRFAVVVPNPPPVDAPNPFRTGMSRRLQLSSVAMSPPSIPKSKAKAGSISKRTKSTMWHAFRAATIGSGSWGASKSVFIVTQAEWPVAFGERPLVRQTSWDMHRRAWFSSRTAEVRSLEFEMNGSQDFASHACEALLHNVR
jgi:hypothetical protein